MAVPKENSPKPTPEQACDLCGGVNHLLFAEKGRGSSALRTVICRACGLVHTNPRPSEQANADFYHKDYWGQYKSQSVPDEAFFRRRLPKIKPLLQLLRPHLRPGVKVLEVGCGVGALLWSIKSLVGTGTFIGVEPHDGHAKFAREVKGLDVRNALLEEVETSLPRAHFDLVVMNHVLEHTVSPTQTLTTLKQLLRPGGLFAAEVPNIEAPGSRLSHFFHVAHHHNFSPHTLQRLAVKCGFRTRQVSELDGDLPRTRLLGIFENSTPDPDVALHFIRDDADERATALRRYERWYWLTGASLRKKITHWQRQQA